MSIEDLEFAEWLEKHGMVAAGHPLAAEAGMRILKAGGNAVDAAMATWAVQGEVEPGMTGLGADMFVLIYLAKTGEVKFINASGFAPQAATIDFYKSKGGIPDSGPLLTPNLLDPKVREALAAKGHTLDLRDVRGVGSVKGIMVDPRTGVLMGGVSPTGDSYVMAW